MGFFLSRRFLPLFITQFLGAFNDNFLKNALVVLITYRLATQTGQNPQILVALAAALFILPYFLFSSLAGEMADSLPREKIARVLKLAEIVMVLLAWLGFVYGSVVLLMVLLFLMGAQSTFFSPVKYALLPQHLQEGELLAGNACIGAGTFLAILLGTIAGGLLILQPAGEMLGGLVLVAMALAGYGASLALPSSPPPAPQLRPRWRLWRGTRELLHYSRSVPSIHRTILAISWFWFVGATFLAQFPAFARETLHADETVVTLFLTMFSIGVACGAFLCNRLLKGRVSLRGVFWAGLGMSLCALDLGLAAGSHGLPHDPASPYRTAADLVTLFAGWRILLDLFLLAMCGGAYVVPLYAALQKYGDPQHLARLVATNNIINAAYMVASSVFIIVLVKAGATIPQIFLAVGGINLLVVLRWRYGRGAPVIAPQQEPRQ